MRLRRAEAVLARRTSRVILVLEQTWDDVNVQAILRTADTFGVQHVWLLRHPAAPGKVRRAITRGSQDWLTLRTFEGTDELLRELRRSSAAIWATDLSQRAESVNSPEVLRPVPERVALVMGREVDGVSPALLEAADRRLYLPMQGFTESFNLSVATALLLQRLFDADPSLVGVMSDEERVELRRSWYARLGGRDERKHQRYENYLESPPDPLPESRPQEAHRAPRYLKGAHWRREPADGE